MKTIQIVKLKNRRIRIEFYKNQNFVCDKCYENAIVSDSAEIHKYYSNKPEIMPRKAIKILVHYGDTNEYKIVESFKLKNNNISVIESPEYLEEKKRVNLKEQKKKQPIMKGRTVKYLNGQTAISKQPTRMPASILVSLT